MVGMIVLGHDHFADGLSGSLEMIWALRWIVSTWEIWAVRQILK